MSVNNQHQQTITRREYTISVDEPVCKYIEFPIKPGKKRRDNPNYKVVLRETTKGYKQRYYIKSLDNK